MGGFKVIICVGSEFVYLYFFKFFEVFYLQFLIYCWDIVIDFDFFDSTVIVIFVEGFELEEILRVFVIYGK